MHPPIMVSGHKSYVQLERLLAADLYNVPR